MSDVTSETQTEKTFDPEAFAMNLARAMESSGQALAAYLKPRENGDPKDKPPSELTEVVKTFSTIAEYWLSDKARVLILVWDANPRPPELIAANEEAESGRGLLLVETISERWDWYFPPATGGKVVWALAEMH